MLLLLGVIAVGSLLWHAQSEGLGKGGEILFETALVVGAVWLADSLNLGILGMIVFVGIAGLYLQHRKKKAERLAQAEFRKQVTGLDDKQRAEITKLLAENYRKAGFKKFADRLLRDR